MEVAPIKKLGQNFLRRVPKTLLPPLESLKTNDNVLAVEIGPGTGRLTYEALQVLSAVTTNVWFLGIEIDTRMQPYLDAIAREFRRFKLRFYYEDVLSVNLTKLLQIDFNEILGEDFKLFIFGSLPYNISKRIVKWSIFQTYTLLKTYENVTLLPYRFLLQREVAENYTSTPPNADFLSIYLSLFTLTPPRVLEILPKTAFEPIPKVEGAVLEFLLDTEKVLHFKSFEYIARIIRRFFGYKRKTLRKIVKSDKVIAKLNLAIEEYKDYRPTELSVNDWLALLDMEE